MQKKLWEKGARLSLRGALLKMGIQKGKGWDARTRPQGRRTRVRRGGTRGRGRDAAHRASVPRGKSRIGPTRLKSAPIRRKSAPMRPKSGRLGPYWPYRPKRPKRPSQAEIQKKKKGAASRPLTFRPASLTPSLISLLCVTHCAPMKQHPSIPAVLCPSS